MFIMNANIKKQLDSALDAVKGKKITSIYFVACGGSQATLTPAQYICDRELDIPSYIYTSNEFVHRQPKLFTKDSLVITCSHSGNTPETVEATKIATEKGCVTISFMNKEKLDSPLGAATKFPIGYEYKTDEKPIIEAVNSNSGLLYALVFGIVNILNPNEKYQRAIQQVSALDRIYEVNKEATYTAADEFGQKYKRANFIYTMASGINYSVAYSFSICLLMEMLWINSNSIHSGEYFHGPFEITDFDVPFIMIKGIGETRPLDDRAHNFLQKYSKEISLVDAESFDMDGIDKDLRNYFAPLVINTVLRQYADRISEHKGHPLSVRRYMWKMEY